MQSLSDSDEMEYEMFTEGEVMETNDSFSAESPAHFHRRMEQILARICAEARRQMEDEAQSSGEQGTEDDDDADINNNDGDDDTNNNDGVDDDDSDVDSSDSDNDSEDTQSSIELNVFGISDPAISSDDEAEESYMDRRISIQPLKLGDHDKHNNEAERGKASNRAKNETTEKESQPEYPAGSFLRRRLPIQRSYSLPLRKTRMEPPLATCHREKSTQTYREDSLIRQHCAAEELPKNRAGHAKRPKSDFSFARSIHTCAVVMGLSFFAFMSIYMSVQHTVEYISSCSRNYEMREVTVTEKNELDKFMIMKVCVEDMCTAASVLEPGNKMLVVLHSDMTDYTLKYICTDVVPQQPELFFVLHEVSYNQTIVEIRKFVSQ